MTKYIEYFLCTFVCILVSSCHQNAKEVRFNDLSDDIGETVLLDTSFADVSDKTIAVQQTSSSVLDGEQIFQRYGSSVFMVFTSDGTNEYQGSGFFIGEDGLAVSNYHVFKGTAIGQESIHLSGDQTQYKVTEIIHRDEVNDFILFRVNVSNNGYIPLSAKKPAVGTKVYAIGSPHGLENTLSSGDVSQWRTEFLMQTSVPIDHGSSGGALIDKYGGVVGITSGTLDQTSNANLNYAISVEVLKPYLTFDEQ